MTIQSLLQAARSQAAPLFALLRVSLVALAATAPLGAQDQEQGPPPLPPELGGPDPRQEMLELFARVELNLRAIDDMLYEASTGRAPLENVEESGIEDLLRNSLDQGSQVLEDIDKILEIAEQQAQQQQGNSSSQPSEGDPSQGSSGQQPSGEQGQRESTPENPDQVQGQEEGQEPKPEPGEQPDGQQPEGQEPRVDENGNPLSPRDANDPDPQNRDGQNPPSESTARVRVIQDVERWGELPIHVREIFSSEGGSDDMPAQYRDWIESYYRRLSKTGG